MLNNLPLVTIIIPIYNAEKFLDKCLKSIVMQSYQNLDIILIDDGSKDRSSEKCDCWVNKDKRISVVHKKNEGVSIARNTGMDMAKGQYICFVDSDDWLPSDAIQKLVDCIVEDESDFGCGATKKVGVYSSPVYSIGGGFTCTTNDTELMITFMRYLKGVSAPWGKIYKKSIIDKYRIFFPEGIAYGEDSIFLWNYLSYCNKIAVSSECVYFYSMLNDGNASQRFYPDLYKWTKKAVDGYSCVIKNKCNERDEEINKYALKMLDLTCMRYALAKIREEDSINYLLLTFEEFNEYISNMNPRILKEYTNSRLFYTEIQDNTPNKDCCIDIIKEYKMKEKGSISKHMRLILVYIYDLLVYRFNILYRA